MINNRMARVYAQMLLRINVEAEFDIPMLGDKECTDSLMSALREQGCKVSHIGPYIRIERPTLQPPAASCC